MKASFRTLERDEEQRNRKWQALLWGLIASGAGVGIALGPLVPSTPATMIGVIAASSALGGALVGWRVRERKGSMGGMVAQLFAFPLGCLIAGPPQQPGLNWIIALFVAVPFAAFGGSMGVRATRRATSWPGVCLAVGGTLTLAVAGLSRVAIGRRHDGFIREHQPALVRQFDASVIRGARHWDWQVRWQKGIWSGDYLLLRAQPAGWQGAHLMVSDTDPPRLLTFWASRRGTRSLVPAADESVARNRLLALGFREMLLVRPLWNETLAHWEYGRPRRPRIVIYTRRDDAAVMFDGREPAASPTRGPMTAAR